MMIDALVCGFLKSAQDISDDTKRDIDYLVRKRYARERTVAGIGGAGAGAGIGSGIGYGLSKIRGLRKLPLSPALGLTGGLAGLTMSKGIAKERTKRYAYSPDYERDLMARGAKRKLVDKPFAVFDSSNRMSYYDKDGKRMKRPPVE